MKNVWKGLIVGALTGMVGGSVMDLAAATRRKGVKVAHEVIEKAPSVAKAATHKTADALHDADVSGKMRDVAHHLGESDVAEKTKSIVGEVLTGLGH
jgi:hypothetical protein